MMNARLISKMAFVAIGFLMLVWLGLNIGRWASEQSNACEARYQDAVEVLRGN
jgi:hypothetical protein